MHKVTKSALAIAVGASLALAIPVSASAATASTAASASGASSVVLSNHSKTVSHHKPAPKPVVHHKPTPKPSHTKPAYPPTKPTVPPRPPWFPPPFWWGGWLWIPFYFGPGSFHPGSIIHCNISGYGGFSFHATFLADESGSLDLGTAAADGSLSAQIKAAGGSDLAGQTLNATFVDSTGATQTQTVTIPADVAKSSATTSSSTTAVKAADPALAATGTYISVATVWGAVGLVALGAGFVTMRTVVRRKDRAKA